MRDTIGISKRLGRAIWTLFNMRRETKCPFLVASDIGIPINVQKESGNFTF